MSHDSLGHDPYRDWLRTRLGKELGLPNAELAIQGAVLRRGWPALQALGPRDVVAVLQDVYSTLRQTIGDARADAWLQSTTVDLAAYAQTVPVPAQPTPGPIAPSPAPLRWGRRAYDLPLLLARAQSEIAGRSLAGIRANPELLGLAQTAQWDLQAAQAEVRRWETEAMLSSLRADHSRIEVADAVVSAAAQAEWLRLSVREFQIGQARSPGASAQLAHIQLILTQLDAFLEVFPPLINLADADLPLASPGARLEGDLFELEVPLNPAVLRARHTLLVTQWQAEAEPNAVAAVAQAQVVQAQHALAQAEAEARSQLEATLNTARACHAQFVPLYQHTQALEERMRMLGQLGGDPMGLARTRLEWRQGRAAARIQGHLLEQSMRLLEALVDAPSEPNPRT
ncbi:hypothetical protein [Deinococcus arenicola]|uniref:TolC family protein n=1 Tax=Deinococcus arenicola TaxID=2994950 RepID=A0ABU4DNJ6_9DEIO|nr:hypothetical protein [Deinococcus sp. ZS9-10]MDV6373460.1 hypothetical protein [Deinococcus sp. ZS9-10]